MPYETHEARKAAYDAWYARNRDKRAAYAKLRREDRRERYWRFKLWEAAHMKPEVKEAIEQLWVANSALVLDNPKFVFELNGKRWTDTLHDPLPQW